MAIASYNTDLIDIIANISSITGWVALGGGGAGLGIGADFAMQGANAVDKQITASEKGQLYNTTAITIPTGYHVFVWVFLATPGLTNTLQNRGLGIVIGSGTTAYNTFHVEGSDTYGGFGRVGKCYPIKYDTTASAVVPYRTRTGVPATNPSFFGATSNILASVKGANLGVSAIRYGTGIFITAGDSGQPATFLDSSITDGNVNNRWSIITYLGGSAFELQGSYVIGQNSSKVPTLAYFVDSNKNISLVDTPHSETSFTKIIIDHASTYISWTNINIEATGTNNKGQLIFNNATTSGVLDSCNFSKLDITTLRPNISITSCNWRQCGKITTNNAVISNTIIKNSTATIAMTTANLTNISSCTFGSGGTGYGLEITTPGTYTFSGNTFTGYGANLTTNAAIYNNSGGLVTINISGGTTPTYNNGAGSSTVINNSIVLNITGIVSLSDVVILNAGTSVSLVNIDQNVGSTYQYTYTIQKSIDIGIFKTGYIPFYIRNYSLGATNSSVPVDQKIDRNYQ